MFVPVRGHLCTTLIVLVFSLGMYNNGRFGVGRKVKSVNRGCTENTVFRGQDLVRDVNSAGNPVEIRLCQRVKTEKTGT